MNEKMVSMKLKDLPPLTETDHERLAALAARPDSEIDQSDIPELTEEDWKNAVRGKHYRPVKAQITASLDKDVRAWLKSEGRGYQTRMNAILRREMLQARASAGRK
ncbi:BrnA antitoxin family protein [Aquidulcibacter paucihalophilus]|uniref:BrnA antitoxin family protein n=1 Tax=Aquidulcibacter paucihalophilus TaxID=1978549 RepID=UPI000A18A939|nr:BrnA antitoxin family protein [Aquidulcibacter paucihalophilus]